MERGLYEWPGRTPKHNDGSYRVIKSQILKDCGQNPQYSNQNKLLWKNPEFLALLDAENKRRDCAIVGSIKETIEAVSGPLLDVQQHIHKHVLEVFMRPPDAEDPLALSPDQYVARGILWDKHLNELTGKVKSQEEQAIQSVVSSLVQRDKITADMMGDALGLIDKYRDQQDRQMQHAGLVIDGELDELRTSFGQMTREERTWILVRSYPLFAAYYFDLSMVDFMADMVKFSDEHQRACILIPAGHTKSATFGNYNIIRHICWNPNVRIQLVMSVFDDAEEYCKAIENELTSTRSSSTTSASSTTRRTGRAASSPSRQRQHNDPHATLTVYGAGGKAPNWSLKGKGCDLAVMDDVVTEDTSSTPESRRRQSSWAKMTVFKNPRPMWPIDRRYGLMVPPGITWPKDAALQPPSGRATSPTGRSSPAERASTPTTSIRTSSTTRSGTRCSSTAGPTRRRANPCGRASGRTRPCTQKGSRGSSTSTSA